jgi:uncharacterized protein
MVKTFAPAKATKSKVWRGLGVCAAALVVGLAPFAAAQGLGSLLRQLAQPPQQQTGDTQTTQPNAAKDQSQTNGQSEADGDKPKEPPKPQRSWLGYSLQVQAMRPLLLKGDFAGARTAYETGKDAAGEPLLLPAPPPNPDGTPAQPSGLAAMLGVTSTASGQPGQTASAPPSVAMSPLLQKERTFLNNAELGVLMLDSGDLPNARAAFDSAGGLIGTGAAASATDEKKGFGAGAARVFRSVGRAVATTLGNAELGPYDAPDFERVLQLNYLSLSYLLAGDDKAFNVSRRVSERQQDAFENLNDKAARMQDEARAKFEAEQAEAQKKLEEARAGSGGAEGKSDVSATDSALKAAYETPDFCKPPNLPSAYVNPLGFYLNGVVYEVSSQRFLEDIDAARISYEKALKLAPNSATLRRAVAELNQPKGRPGRLVHVMVAEGFAPTRQAIRMQLTINNMVAPITIPRLTCHVSEVASIQVRDQTGKVLGALDPMANIEGMMLQRQKDREGITALSVFANSVRGALENRAGQQNALLGLVVGVKQEAFDRPDMRSWSTLPARFHAGRIMAPTTATSLQVVTLNARGSVLSTQTVQLDTESKQNVVYLRATDQALTAAPPTQLWIKGL